MCFRNNVAEKPAIFLFLRGRSFIQLTCSNVAAVWSFWEIAAGIFLLMTSISTSAVWQISFTITLKSLLSFISVTSRPRDATQDFMKSLTHAKVAIGGNVCVSPAGEVPLGMEQAVADEESG